MDGGGQECRQEGVPCAGRVDLLVGLGGSISEGLMPIAVERDEQATLVTLRDEQPPARIEEREERFERRVRIEVVVAGTDEVRPAQER